MQEGDTAAYVTVRTASEVEEDMKGYEVWFERPIIWMDTTGSRPNSLRFDANNLLDFSVNLKRLTTQAATTRLRVIIDVLSPLLLLNPTATIYRFFEQLLTELKRSEVLVLATLEEGMHEPKDIAAFEQLFDGVLEMRFYEQGLTVIPLLRVKKMRGLPPYPGFFEFRFAKGRLQVSAYTR